MRTPRFYCADLDINHINYVLPDSVHRHAVQVLRLKAGAKLRLFNGLGDECEVELDIVSKRQSEVVIQHLIENEIESNLSVTLLQGISRGERMDYALQKAVELGVNKIIPVITERCNVQFTADRAEKRLTHWRGIMINACEQSGRSKLPEIEDVQTLAAVQAKQLSGGIVLDPMAKKGLATLPKQTQVNLLIGSEGGLSKQEIDQVTQQGYQAVQFGPRILRTETATAAALAALQTLWGDMG